MFQLSLIFSHYLVKPRGPILAEILYEISKRVISELQKSINCVGNPLRVQVILDLDYSA